MALAAPVEVGIMERADRGHGAADDFELVVDDLGYRRQAVGGAGSVRDDVVRGGVVLVLVYAHDDGDVFILGRGGDDDLFYRSAQVLLGVFGVGEASGRFDDDLCTDGFPIDFGGVFFGKNLEFLSLHVDGITAGGNFVMQVAEDRIVLQ